MRIGYVTPNSWGIADPHQVVALAVRAEQLGAASVWVSHHVLHDGFVGERLGRKPYYDPLVMLTAMATATTRVRLGTSVLVLPYLHPMPTAKALATIDHLSGGRLDVGVGAGGLRGEHEAIGRVPFEERGRYTDEFLSVLGLLWAGGPSSFAGRYFAFDGVEAYPLPARPEGMPVLVGGNGGIAVRRAVRFGSGWHGIGLEPTGVSALRSRMGDALTEAGRTLGGFAFQMRLHVAVDDLDAGAWRDRAAEYEAAGLDELVLAPQSGDVGGHHHWLESVLGALGR